MCLYMQQAPADGTAESTPSGDVVFEISVTVEHIDAGVGLDKLTIQLKFIVGVTPYLAIELAEVFSSGGKIYFRDARIDPTASAHEILLNVSELDLAEIFTLMAIDGVSGSGRLSGTLPIRVRGGVVLVDEGRVAANGPGVLQIKSQRAVEALAGAGEQVDLLLRALEDFHYEELSLTINKSFDDTVSVALSTLGNNPGVLDAHPFRLNINLEGRATKLFAVLTEVYGVSNALLQRAWSFDR